MSRLHGTSHPGTAQVVCCQQRTLAEACTGTARPDALPSLLQFQGIYNLHWLHRYLAALAALCTAQCHHISGCLQRKHVQGPCLYLWHCQTCKRCQVCSRRMQKAVMAGWWLPRAAWLWTPVMTWR